jgi:hypothetical protein
MGDVRETLTPASPAAARRETHPAAAAATVTHTNRSTDFHTPKSIGAPPGKIKI